MGSRSAALSAVFVLVTALPARAHPGVEELRAAVERDVAADPESPEKLLEVVAVYRVGGEWDAALAALEHAAQHGADADVVEATRGAIYLEAAWPQMAIVSFDRVLQRRPENVAVRFGRARALALLRRWVDAAADFATAFSAARQPRPEDAFAWRDALLAAGRPELALAALDTALERLGPVPSVQLAAIDLALTLERRDDALRRVDAMVSAEPKNAALQVRRGEILTALGREAEARAAFAAALELIEARPAQRRGPRTLALEQQVRAALGAPGKGADESVAAPAAVEQGER